MNIVSRDFDRSFSRDDAAEALRAIKRRLDESAIDLIVDRIESEAQLVELLDLPVDFGQGLLFGEPRTS